MPDFQQYSLARAGTVALPNAPQWRVEVRIVHETTGAVIRDFTGANAVFFPQILGSLSAAEQDQFVAQSMNWLLNHHAGTG